MDLVNLSNKVKKLLEENPELRDSDRALVEQIWKEEFLSQNIENIGSPSRKFLSLYRDNKITSESSIRRARRKVNQHYPDTRGNSYFEGKKLVPAVLSDLHDIAEEAKHNY